MNLILLTIIFILATMFAIAEINFSGKNYSLLYFIFAIIISLIFSFRGLYTPDTFAYVDAYKNIDLFNIVNTNIRNFEFGFILLMSIIKYIFGNEYKIFFFFTSIISYIIIYFSLTDIFLLSKSKGKYYMLAMILYSSFYGIYYQGIVLRAGLAILFYYYSIIQLIKGKYIKFFCLCIISVLFHKSILFVLTMPFIFLYKKEHSNKFYNIIILLILCFAFAKLYLFISPVLLIQMKNFIAFFNSLNKFEIYLRIGNLANRLEYKSIYYILIGFILVNQKIKNTSYKKLINIYIFGLIISVTIGSFNNINRILDLYRILYVYIFVYAVSYYSIFYKSKKLYYSIITIIFVVFNYIIFYSNIYYKL